MHFFKNDYKNVFVGVNPSWINALFLVFLDQMDKGS